MGLWSSKEPSPNPRRNASIKEGGFILCVWYPHAAERSETTTSMKIVDHSPCISRNPDVGHAALIIFRVHPERPKDVEHKYYSFCPIPETAKTWKEDLEALGPPKTVIPLAGETKSLFERGLQSNQDYSANRGARNCVTFVLELLKDAIPEFREHNMVLPGSLAREAIKISNKQFPISASFWFSFPLQYLKNVPYKAISDSVGILWKPSDSAPVESLFQDLEKADVISQNALEEEDKRQEEAERSISI